MVITANLVKLILLTDIVMPTPTGHMSLQTLPFLFKIPACNFRQGLGWGGGGGSGVQLTEKC